MRTAIALTLTLILTLSADADAAQAQSIAGEWAGKGFVQSTVGTKETVQCRVKYRRASGKDFGLSATCTTASGKTKSVQGNVIKSKNNRYAGRISFGGAVAITVSGNRQTLTVSSVMGKGRMTLVRR